MKKLVNAKILPWFTLGAGAVGFLLRVWLHTLKDEAGLLPHRHSSITLLFLLTAFVMVVLFLWARSIHPDGTFSQRFTPSVWGAVGNAAAALGIGVTCVKEYLSGTDLFNLICLPIGILAAIGLLFAAFRRLKGSTPPFLGYCAVTVYLMLRGVCQCRGWGAEPQLINYCFLLMASIFLMLTAYHRTALTLNKGNYRWFLFTSQASVFFCCLSVYSASSLFYLTMTVWSFCDLCSPQEV